MTVDFDGYEKYVQEHISAVQLAGDHLGIPYSQMQIHDASKWSHIEFDAYANQFYGDEDSQDQASFDRAWLHHIHNNPHHWDHWLLEGKPLEMPELSLLEMIADWLGMAIQRTGDMTDWLIPASGGIVLHKNTASFVENVLRSECDDWLDMTNFRGFKVVE